MHDQFLRTSMLLGRHAVEKLKRSHVAVFGIGGVGGYVAEALARGGVGALSLIDHDVVSESNINRQIIALHSTVGRLKVEVMRERILDINPDAQVYVYPWFYNAETAGNLDFSVFDYIADAVDTVTAKLIIIQRAYDDQIKVISSMGAGNKLEPGAFEVADIYSTSVCPLARVMRRELRARGIEKLKAVYSKEQPRTPQAGEHTDENSRKRPPGSVSFVPPGAALVLAGEIIKDLTDIR